MKRLVIKRKRKQRDLDSKKYLKDLNKEVGNEVLSFLYTNDDIYLTLKDDITNSEETKIKKYLKDKDLKE